MIVHKVQLLVGCNNYIINKTQCSRGTATIYLVTHSTSDVWVHRDSVYSYFTSVRPLVRLNQATTQSNCKNIFWCPSKCTVNKQWCSSKTSSQLYYTGSWREARKTASVCQTAKIWSTATDRRTSTSCWVTWHYTKQAHQRWETTRQAKRGDSLRI